METRFALAEVFDVFYLFVADNIGIFIGSMEDHQDFRSEEIINCLQGPARLLLKNLSAFVGIHFCRLPLLRSLYSRVTLQRW
jgi:hypothetical protein